VRTNSPAGAPFGAVHTATLKAAFTYAGSGGLPVDNRTRQDVTTIGTSATAGLQLVKTVDKPSARPGETITYTITYTNAGTAPLSDLFIADSTPHYTVFVSAAAGPLPADLTAVAITAPAAGETGAIRWTFTGTLAAGAGGTVTFSVKVQE